MTFVLRRWWPTLALVALGLVSVALLRSAHVQSREILQQTIASLDNVAESRRRLLHAYLIHDRQSAGDATFGQSSALAELRAAKYALRNWAAGRSGIVDFKAAVPTDDALLPTRRKYEAALDRLREVLTARPDDTVELRRRFSEAEQAAAALEAAIHAAVRTSVRAEERAYRLRLAGWGFLLLVSVLGATYARRALRTSEGRRAESESRLSRLREVAPVGIAECDRDGRVLAANLMWCRFTTRPEGSWLGEPWWDALAEDDRERGRMLWAGVPTDQEVTAEARLDGAPADAGAERWVLIRVGETGPGGLRAERRVVTFTDITQQREVEAQLHHAQRMEAVGRLAGGVAHDFNNLLTSIGGFAALAREAANGEQELDADLLEIERAADRGRALTRQLLTFSRQDRPHPRIVDVRSVVRELHRMLDRLVSDDVVIDTVLPDTAATVLADASQLEQVITNLVINASDAMDGRGRVRIAVETVRVDEIFRGAKSDIPPGRYVLLSVADTGPGIPAAVRERIFEPFFTTKERGKGTGLGLSTVWGIVRQAGGHIHLYSAAGQGTVFKIYLPTEAGVAAEPPAAGGRAPASIEPGIVLVVEDEDAVRRLTCRVLELHGWTVLAAADGDEAFRIMEAQEDGVDLLITDVMMRGVGGVELVERLQARGVHVPTLFVSGYADSEVRLERARFLEKPFTPDALLRAVATAMAESRDPDTRTTG